MRAVGHETILSGRDLVKEYREGDAVHRVLDGLSLEVAAGGFVAVMGPSGSGKSTLLHLLGGLDVPTSGDVVVEGRTLSELSDNDRTLLRRKSIGIVYQFFNLVPVLTVEENVALPAVIAAEPEDAWRPRLEEVLELVGLVEHKDKLPNQLAGGQQQRTAIARALLPEPTILLADEPTGNLDLRTGFELLEVLGRANADRGQTILLATHDPQVASQADEVHLLRGGNIEARVDPAEGVPEDARTVRAHEARARRVLSWLQDLGAARPARSEAHW